VSDFTAFLVLSMVIGANYGANLSIFPTVTKGWFGMKNFGVNYGLVFTAWGFGGLVLAQIAGKVYDATGSYGTAYLIAAGALVVAAGLAFVVKRPSEAASGLDDVVLSEKDGVRGVAERDEAVLAGDPAHAN
jgi:nitrate/nitrite transporter NarK